MGSLNNNSEHFSCDFSKLKFDANKPGKETRKTMGLFGVIVIVILVVILLALAYLPVNPWAIGAFGGSTAVITAIVKAKNVRSP